MVMIQSEAAVAMIYRNYQNEVSEEVGNVHSEQWNPSHLLLDISSFLLWSTREEYQRAMELPG